jgi:chorismate mutase/prephenate dehydratase
MPDQENKLKDLRRQIDALDREIVDSLQLRAELAITVGEAKGDNIPIYVPERERQVLAQVAEKAIDGPLGTEAVTRIYREILSACRALEKPTGVTYLGPENTFTHQAALQAFGGSANLQAAASVDHVFLLVERGVADYGVVPLENSTEGGVTPTLDSFVQYLDTAIQICGEIVLPIAHNLISNSPRDEIRVVYSHPQALAQCRGWLAEELPQAEMVEIVSTAAAVARIKDETGAAAIASDLAAQAEGVPIIARDIQDRVDNVTRFAILGKQLPAPTENDRTALVFSVVDQPGSLYNALGIFAAHGVNLSFILSRPSRRRTWDYYFFAILIGHPSREPVRTALEELEKLCVLVRILGAWPALEASGG